MPGQLTYTLNNKGGVPGMLYSKPSAAFIDSKPCGATALGYGIIVELVAGVLRPAQGTGNPNASTIWGITLWQDTMEPGGYTQGMDVPVVRKGQIWVAVAAGAAFTQGAVTNYWHSSNGSNPQGQITSAAVSGTVGSEISTFNGIWYFDGGLVGGTPSTAVIDFTMP